MEQEVKYVQAILPPGVMVQAKQALQEEMEEMDV